MQFPFGPILWYEPWWESLFIEWPIIKREFLPFANLWVFSFFAKLELQCACPLFFPLNKIIWFSEHAICKFVSFFFLANLEVCMCLSSYTHPLTSISLGPTKDVISFAQNENKICLTTALAVLNWLKLSFAYHLHEDQNTPKKNSSRNQSSAKSLEVVSYKLSSQSARRLAKK